MSNKKIVVIGGVAAGTKAAAKIRREIPDAQITVVTKDKNISYAGCGLPYYIGGAIPEREQLLARTPEQLKATLGLDIRTEHEAVGCDTKKKIVKVVNLPDKTEFELPYDSMVIATGAEAIVPPVKGIDLKNIHKVRNLEDTDAIKALLDSGKVKNALVVGGGYIGIEMAEALHARGAKTTIVEALDHILTIFDEQISMLLEKHIRSKGVDIITGKKVVEFKGGADGCVASAMTEGGAELPADIVIWCTGVKPSVEFARTCGVELGETGAIKVNTKMQTNVADIYAAGDCAESIHLLTGKPAWVPLGSTANKMGRVAAMNIAGRPDELKGILASGTVKVFDYNTAMTGLSEEAARKAGYEAESVMLAGDDIAHYYPGSKPIIVKLVACKKTRRVLGAQVIGEGITDKPVNMLVSVITLKGTIDDVAKMDYAYAPPYSSAMDMVITAANTMINKLDDRVEWTNSLEVRKMIERGDKIQMIDIRPPEQFTEAHVKGAINIPWGQLYGRKDELDKDATKVINCAIGRSCWGAGLGLQHLGVKNLLLCQGGMAAFPFETEKG